LVGHLGRVWGLGIGGLGDLGTEGLRD
jgi:hypothetical protein